MMGPGYEDNPRYEAKLTLLANGELDEHYCYLYVPEDLHKMGSQAANELLS